MNPDRPTAEQSTATESTATGSTVTQEGRALAMLLGAHQQAIASYIHRAATLTPEQWTTPRAEGKWTPAEETAHVVLVARAFADGVRGVREMELLVTPERSEAIQRAILPRILESGWFPEGGTAPPGTEPELETRAIAQSVVLADLAEAAHAFEESVLDAYASDPERRVTHPYFGSLRLPEILGVSARHVKHHEGHLPGTVNEEER